MVVGKPHSPRSFICAMSVSRLGIILSRLCAPWFRILGSEFVSLYYVGVQLLVLIFAFSFQPCRPPYLASMTLAISPFPPKTDGSLRFYMQNCPLCILFLSAVCSCFWACTRVCAALTCVRRLFLYPLLVFRPGVGVSLPTQYHPGCVRLHA